MKKQLFFGVLGAVAMLTPGMSQEYPSPDRTLTIVVPSTAGGGSDVNARLFQPLLEAQLGIPVQIENRAGASMQIGTSYVANAEPDGYTVLWAVLPTIASAYLDPERGADFTRSDLAPVVQITEAPFAISVRADSPYQTLQDLIDAAKADPASVRSGTTGIMSTGHFANIAFQEGVGLQLPTVHFQGGGPEMIALLGGHIDVAFNGTGEVIEHVRSGAVRVLGLMADERHPLLPDVATTAEQNLSVAPMGSFGGLVVPAGTPDEVIDVLARAVETASKDADLRQMITARGDILAVKNADDYAAHWDDIDKTVEALIPVAKQAAQ